MPVPSLITDISTTAASNSPVGSDPIGGTLDDYLRNIQAIVKKQFVKGTDLASAATLPVPVEGAYFVVTGTTTITAFANCYDGRTVTLYFPAGITLTHSSALVLPGAANIVTQAGDCGTFVNDGTNIWRCVNYSTSSQSINPNRQNLLINGSFDFFQRYSSFNIPMVGDVGTSITSGVSGSRRFADCWNLNYTPRANAFLSIKIYNVRSDPSSGYSRYGIYITNATNLSSFSFESKIENAGTMAGKYVYASAYVAGAGTYNFQIIQNFGTGGSPSSSVTLTSSNLTVASAAWQRIGALFPLGSVTGKTFGTNEDSYLSFKLNSVSVSASTVYLSDCQLEESASGVSSPTILGRRPIGQELALSQRYIEKSFDTYAANVSSDGGYHQTTATTAYILANGTVRFKVNKSSITTITLYSTGDGASSVVAEYNSGGTWIANRIASVVASGRSSFTVQVSGTATPGNDIRFHWLASSEL